MRALAAFVLALGLTLTPAAGHAAAEGVFMNTCSPNDQLALQVSIPTPDDRTLETRIWGDALENLASGQMLLLSFGGQQQSRIDKDIYLCNDRRCEPSKGQLRVGTYRARDFFDGELLWHNDGTVVSLTFAARFVDNPTPCD